MSGLFGYGSITVWASNFSSYTDPYDLKKDDLLLKKIQFDTLLSGTFMTNNGSVILVDITANQAKFEATGIWNAGNNFALKGSANDMLGKSLVVDNFAYVDIHYTNQSTVGVDVTANDVKGADVKLTDYDDHLTISMTSNGGGIFANLFNVKTFDGDDTVVFLPGTHAGAGINNTGSDSYIHLHLGAGNDTSDLSAVAATSWVYGQEGQDIIHGGSGDDFLRGGLGDDTIVAGSGNDSLIGNQGNDVLVGGLGQDELRGGLGDDVLIADFSPSEPNASMGAADVLRGGAGDDILIGGAGNDTIDGGADVDTAVYSGNSSEYTITSLGGKKYAVTHNISGPNDGADFLIHVEQLQFTNGIINLVNNSNNTAPMGNDDLALGLKEDTTLMTSGNVILGDGIGGVADADDQGDLLTITSVNGTTISAGGTTLAGIYGTLLINPDGSYTYTLNNGTNGDGGNLVQQFAEGSIHEDNFIYTVSDGSLSDNNVLLSVQILGTNDKPVVDQGIVSQMANEDSLFHFNIPGNAFKDVDLGNNLTLSATLANGDPLPAWLVFDPMTNSFTGTPLNENVGTISIEVMASDGLESVSTTFDLTVNNTNDAPVVDQGIVDQMADAGSTFSLAIPSDAFFDVDVGDTLTYTALLVDMNGDLVGDGSLSSWLSFDGTSFTGTPLNTDAGDIYVKVTADDGHGDGAAFDIFKLTVNATSQTPAVIGGVDAAYYAVSAAAGGARSGLLTITDPDAGEAFFVATTYDGTIGDLAVQANGNWTWTHDVGVPLPTVSAGNYVTEDFMIQSVDGTEHKVSIVFANLLPLSVVVGTNNVDSIDNSAVILNKTYYGLDGIDAILAGNGNDTLYGGAGPDFLSGGEGNDIIYGEHNLTLIELMIVLGNVGGTSGGPFDPNTVYAPDVVFGNLITGGTGTDTLVNPESIGNYSFSFAPGHSSDGLILLSGAGLLNITDITGMGANNDGVDNLGVFSGASDIETLRFNGVDYHLVFDANSNAITGTAGSDVMIARNGTQHLSTAGGNDYLYNGHGNQTFIGGLGADTFVFDLAHPDDYVAPSFPLIGLGDDIIADYGQAQGDVLLFQHVFDANGDLSINAADLDSLTSLVDVDHDGATVTPNVLKINLFSDVAHTDPLGSIALYTVNYDGSHTVLSDYTNITATIV